MLEKLDQDFNRVLRQVWEQGYVCLGRTNQQSDADSEWQHRSGFPPSYAAHGRFRFLRVLQLARRMGAKRILEVAAGGGFQAACLYEPGKDILINDLRNLEHELSNWSTGNNIRYVAGNLFELNPQTIGRFDLVIACEVIEHIAHGDRFLAHMKQLMNENGTLLLSTPNGDYFRSRLPTYKMIRNFEELEQRQFQPDADGHLFLYTGEELQSLLESKAYHNISIEYAITPWISGNFGFRFLPSVKPLAGIYRTLDFCFTSSPRAVRQRICTQLIATAKTS